jgi:hypothetical protein
MTTHSIQHHKVVDLAAMKNEIKKIKAHFAPKSEMIKWTVGVGVATILSLSGILSAHMLTVNERISNVEQNLRDLRKDFREDQKETRKEMQQNTAMLAEKIDRLKK